MKHELRVTIELLDSQTVREPIGSEQVLIGLEEDTDEDTIICMEDGGLGEIEATIEAMILDHLGLGDA